MKFYLILGNTKEGVFNWGEGEFPTKGKKNTICKWLMTLWLFMHSLGVVKVSINFGVNSKQ